MKYLNFSLDGEPHQPLGNELASEICEVIKYHPDGRNSDMNYE